MDDKKGEIIDFLAAKSRVREGRPSSTIKINGNNNIVGDNNTYIHTEKVVKEVIAEVKPGIEHITDEQAAELHRLVDDIETLEGKLKQRPKPRAAIWKALNTRFKTPKYRLLKLERYDDAVKYLRQWIGRLSSARSAPRKDGDWRRRKIAYIKINTKHYSLEQRLTEYLERNMGTTAVSSLDDDQLQRAYSTVARWKGKAP